jgi:hypothetical protein
VTSTFAQRAGSQVGLSLAKTVASVRDDRRLGVKS